MEDERKALIAEGFMFINEQDARLAVQERKKIEYLEARMDYSRPEHILAVYEKAIRDRVFKTPVGVQYLKRLQTYLCEQTEIKGDEIPPIPLYLTYCAELRDNTSPAKQRIRPSGKKQRNSYGFPVSVILNVLLVIAIISMFLIMLQSDQPNIINYKRVLVNQYAAWDQELDQREEVIRQKERELNISVE